MKTLSLLLFIAAGLSVAGGDAPFACDRSALTPEARKRHFDELTPALRKQVRGKKELASGFAIELPAEAAAIQLAAEWASNERLCCPFLDIAIRIERRTGAEPGKVWLELSGRDGVKEFLRADLAHWF